MIEINDLELHHRIADFQSDYFEFTSDLDHKEKLAFAKAVFKLNALFEYPAKNYHLIKTFFIDNEFSFSFDKYYGIRSHKTNKGGEVVDPLDFKLFRSGFKQLSDDGSISFERSPSDQMSVFVLATDSFLQLQVNDLKSARTKELNETSLQNRVGSDDNFARPTIKQFALMYYYKIKVGTYSDFTVNEKTKEIIKIASDLGVSQKTLQTAFTNALKSGEDGRAYRMTVLRIESNQEALKGLLKDDKEALLELKKEIAKLGNPLT
ncbi:MAG TPA: hypothetical protein VIU12_08390 [Chryseolinea sp.]